MTNRVLVASVYAPCDRNAVWLGLQKRFLEENTCLPYDFEVWLNRCDPTPFEDQKVRIAGHSDIVHRSMCHEHAAALNWLLTRFRDRVDQYRGFLILDSDAFPAATNWAERLETWMEADEFLPAKGFASACRAENLDSFPHPCCFYVKSSFLKEAGTDLSFSVGPHTNFAGYDFEDVGCGMLRRYNGRHVWLPLMRTNSWNPHPILSAIYGGLFYHHGAGSRPLEIRSVAMRTYDTVFPRYQHAETEKQVYAEISRNPKIFVRQLMGKQP